ncbi:ubiquitin-protein ligase, cullin 4 [Syncephalis fuscata]|nr:ubiquitin-protein ligase, cullin 4 [Syncephalis fuscata]KAI9591866.1 ubiquitin-protein ligase, cullin 4 [Syncephalis fuscata]
MLGKRPRPKSTDCSEASKAFVPSTANNHSRDQTEYNSNENLYSQLGSSGSSSSSVQLQRPYTMSSQLQPRPEHSSGSSSGSSSALGYPSSKGDETSRFAGVATPSSRLTSNSRSGGVSGNSVSMMQRNQPKKLLIKNFKVKPQLPENFENDSWCKLQSAIIAIYRRTKVTDSLEELYRTCENMCYHKLAGNLYNRLQEESKQHVISIANQLKSYTGGHEEFLDLIYQEWTNYCHQVIMIRSIFLYLDRTFVLQTTSIESIWDMHLNLFRNLILNQTFIGPIVLTGLLKLIEQERQGETINRLLVKTLVDMYRDLSFYTSHFEAPFLHASDVFYRTEGDRLLQSDGWNAHEFIIHCEQRLQEEQERSTMYLDERKTGQKLIQAVEECLIRRNIQGLLNKGFSGLVNEKRMNDLRRLYLLCKRVGQLDLLRNALASYIKSKGMAIVSDPEQDSHMVEDLLSIKQHIDDIHTNAFEHAQAFGHTIVESFEGFINTRVNKPAEMIAQYVNMLMKSGNKTASDEELEAILDRILVLFRFIGGKDVFEAFYKRDFAKRLLLNRSASSDMEKLMLAKLRAECGPAFTSKLEGMFKDMDISRDLSAMFHGSKWYIKSEDVDLKVNVLTHGIWPTYHPMEIILPPKMAEYQDAFKQFYNSQHKNRILTWQHSLGHCRLKAYFPKGAKELDVSLLQAIVLLLFNDATASGSLSYQDILKKTGIAPDELQRTLISLSCGKARVLLKSVKGMAIDKDNDRFKFNTKFEAPRIRIKINSVQMKETAKENEETREQVFQDRQFQVDAAIVRIMKSRKQLSHVELSTELYEQIKFQIQPPDLKKRIESLIEREYLERDPDQHNAYKYLA